MDLVQQGRINTVRETEKIPQQIFFPLEGGDIDLATCEVLNRLRPEEGRSGPALFARVDQEILDAARPTQLTMQRPTSGQGPPNDSCAVATLPPPLLDTGFHSSQHIFKMLKAVNRDEFLIPPHYIHRNEFVASVSSLVHVHHVAPTGSRFTRMPSLRVPRIDDGRVFAVEDSMRVNVAERFFKALEGVNDPASFLNREARFSVTRSVP